MMCVFCGNRTKCWNQLSDEQLETEWVKCGYDDYVLDEAIELEDLLQGVSQTGRRKAGYGIGT